MARLAPVFIVALLVAGCGSESSDNADQGGAPPPPPAVTTTAACETPADASTADRMSPALAERETMYLTNVEAEGSRCSDRIVFTFDEAEPGPGYNIAYEPADTAKTEDGSGNAVEIDGDAFLVVRLTPAMTARIDGEEIEPTYTGPRRMTPEGALHAKEVVKTGDFEAMVTWVIGLDGERPFTATATSSQLVVELS